MLRWMLVSLVVGVLTPVPLAAADSSGTTGGSAAVAEANCVAQPEMIKRYARPLPGGGRVNATVSGKFCRGSFYADLVLLIKSDEVELMHGTAEARIEHRSSNRWAIVPEARRVFTWRQLPDGRVWVRDRSILPGSVLTSTIRTSEVRVRGAFDVWRMEDQMVHRILPPVPVSLHPQD